MSSNIQKYNSIIVFIYFTCWFISKLKVILMRKECLFKSSIKLLIENIKNRKELLDWINHPVLNLKGGGKKRKKKNYTKPKKVKHIRKKTKLKVLSYYSVTEKSISKLRKESPESPGCFMADHEDRITCGKTGITFIRNAI